MAVRGLDLRRLACGPGGRRREPADQGGQARVHARRQRGEHPRHRPRAPRLRRRLRDPRGRGRRGHGCGRGRARSCRHDPRRSRRDRLHLGKHGRAEGRDDDARQPRLRDGERRALPAARPGRAHLQRLSARVHLRAQPAAARCAARGDAPARALACLSHARARAAAGTRGDGVSRRPDDLRDAARPRRSRAPAVGHAGHERGRRVADAVRGGHSADVPERPRLPDVRADRVRPGQLPGAGAAGGEAGLRRPGHPGHAGRRPSRTDSPRRPGRRASCTCAAPM